MLLLPTRKPAGSSPRQGPGVRLAARRAVPLGTFPATDLLEIRAGGRQAIVKWGLAHAPCGGEGHSRIVALVDHAERFDGTLTTVLGIGLVGLEAIDVESRDVNIRMARDDPMRQHPAQASPRQ